jgi:DNA-binding CsgD family transcriptional regulator
LLPDHPATLAALLAISMGDVGLARTALDSMVKGGFGPLDKARALVLTAWIDLSEGHYQRVEESLARTDLESPRDDVWWWALRLGLARRRDDLTGLSALWGQARSVLMATPVNLWNILPMAELGVTAARLHEGELATPMWEAGTAIVASLGGVAWGPPFHWAGIQAGILASRPKALGPHAAALVSAARRSHHASVLAEAGRTWVAVLARDVDRYAVVEAAMGLAGISQAWEGARLAAHAAARAADRRDTAVLLECARDLKFPQDAPDPSRTVSSGNDLPVGAIELTAREREVTELVVAGLTYREVASRLFLSAKTVEHHMARIKRRSGAETRGELLHRLSITMSASTGNHVRSGLE